MRSRALILALAFLPVGVAAADDKPAKPVPAIQQWSGIIRDDETLKRQAPVAGHITDAAIFEKLWKAWRPKEALPKVDFNKELVLVATAPGPNRVALSASLDDKGDLKIRSRATLVGGLGFGYAIATISRQGVKSINGKPLK
jgi:hypothetical protein